MSQPQNLPDLLQARLKLGLLNWGRRTLIWSGVLALLSSQIPFLKVALIAWLAFSALSLVGLLLGLKLASHLKTSAAFPSHPPPSRDVGGDRPLDSGEADPSRSSHSHDPIIEIEAEVLPPEPPRPAP